MAEAIVSALAGTIMGNLNSLVLLELGIVGGVKEELEDLRSTFTAVQAVLHDAEQKQWKSKAVKDWLRKLKDAAYDVQDALDDFTIEAQRRQQKRDLKNQVRSFFSPDHNPLAFRAKMARKLKDLRRKLNVIAKERDDLHLRTDVVIDSATSEERETSSVVFEPSIYGRKEEKEKLINSMLNSPNDLSVHAIWGVGGMGKTTLAQLVYNEERVKRNFDPRIWVCVSTDASLKRLTRAIIASTDNYEGASSVNHQELDPLLRQLQEKLSGKKFLLTLDDVWDDKHVQWDKLKDVLRCGAKGSSILLTTRIDAVAQAMEPVFVHRLEELSKESCWHLFKQLALESRSREEYTELQTIGKAIVDKCGGVPLAIKAVGKLMRLKRNRNEWLSIRDSEIWDLRDVRSTIFPSLMLSYMDLPAHLKQCFAFCAIFPEDHVMEKNMLIALWMANDFIPRDGQRDLHDVGHDIFNEIVSRSFFQEVEDIYGNTTCTMHDLMHELAQSIAGNECFRIEPNTTASKVPHKARHLLVGDMSLNVSLEIEDLLKGQSLRTFLDRRWGTDPSPYLSKQLHLRALNLRCRSETLPNSIGNLKLLRYLQVSSSSIRTLPESISSLENLQTLDLSYCMQLFQLPKSMKQLKNLIYLDLRGCDSLRSMPAGMGRLTALRRLGLFSVGKKDGHQIGELAELNYVGGELSIRELGNVRDLTDAKSANLMRKTALKSLELSWDRTPIQNNIKEVLSGLQPHPNLKKLSIKRYVGSEFPSWMMNFNLLVPNLVEIRLEECDSCEQLPPFGKLQFLKHLSLRGMESVRCIGSDVYGDGENPFLSLESLSLHKLQSLEVWATVTDRESFRVLRTLTLDDCPLLDELPNLPSVETLGIENEAKLLKSVRNFTSLTTLMIQSIYDLELLPDGLLQNHTLLADLLIFRLTDLKSILYCGELESLPEEGLHNLNSLESLSINGCKRLNSLPANGLRGLSSLCRLEIKSCDRFASLSEGVRYLTALHTLLIIGCPELNSLPESIQHLTSLRYLEVRICERLSCLPNQIQYLKSLSYLTIQGCPDLMCLPDGIQSLNTLKGLVIYLCPNVESRCEKNRREDWPKIAHIPCIIINNEVIQRLE